MRTIGGREGARGARFSGPRLGLTIYLAQFTQHIAFIYTFLLQRPGTKDQRLIGGKSSTGSIGGRTQGTRGGGAMTADASLGTSLTCCTNCGGLFSLDNRGVSPLPRGEQRGCTSQGYRNSAPLLVRGQRHLARGQCFTCNVPLSELRQEAGLTDAELAAFVGRHPYTLTRWRANGVPLWAQTLLELKAGYLGHLGWPEWRILRGELYAPGLEKGFRPEDIYRARWDRQILHNLGITP